MTSGEIAKKTGISQKTIRLYDEKGLLKPVDYTEGNYRLYDKESLLVLEKIIALKQVGFSLEEIRDNLHQENSMDARDSLKKQLEMMKEKMRQLEKSIACIENALKRSEESMDWDSIATIMRGIQMNQTADEHHFQAMKHRADDEDWYVKIYRSLGLVPGERVLDLGCGFGKVWRNNWSNIPKDVTVDAVDLHGSWADDFADYVEEHKDELAAGTDIYAKWLDVEQEELWSELKLGSYHRVIAHYLFRFLQKPEAFVQHVLEVLIDDGVFCCNDASVSCELTFWKDFFENMELDARFVSEAIARQEKKKDEFSRMLGKYFAEIEEISLSSHMRYDSVEELFERINELFPEQKKFFTLYEEKIGACLDEMLAESGSVVIEQSSTFWHCYK